MDQKLTRQLMRGLGAEEKSQPLASSPEKKKRPSPQKLASQWQERERLKTPKKRLSPGGEGSSRSRFDPVGQANPSGSPSPRQVRNPASQAVSQVSGSSQTSRGRGEVGEGGQSDWRGQMAAVAPGLVAAPGGSQEAAAGSDASQEAASAIREATTRAEVEGDAEGEYVADDVPPKASLLVRGVYFCIVFLAVSVLGLSAFNSCEENASWFAANLGQLGGGLGASSFPSPSSICSSPPAELWIKACGATRGLWEAKARPRAAFRSPLSGRLSSEPGPGSQAFWGIWVLDPVAFTSRFPGSQELSPAVRASTKAIIDVWSSASSAAQSAWAVVSESGLASPWSGRFASGPAGSASQELQDWESRVRSSVVVLEGERKTGPADTKQPAKEEVLLEAAIAASTAAAAEKGAQEVLKVSGDRSDKKDEEEKQDAAVVDPLASLYKSVRETLGASATLQLQSQAIQLENTSIEDPGTALIPEAPGSLLTQATPVALALALVLVLASACLGRLLGGGSKAAGQTAGQPPAGGATSAPEDVAEPQGGGAQEQKLPPPATPPPDSNTPAPNSSAPEPPTEPAAEPATPRAGFTLQSRNFGSPSNSNSSSISKSYGKGVPGFVKSQRRMAVHAAREDSSNSVGTGSLSMAGSGGNSETVSSSSNLVTQGDVILMQSTMSSYGSLSAYKAAKEKEGLEHLTPVRRSARLLNKTAHSPLPSPYLVQ